MKKDEIETRIAELRADRERLTGELEKARVDERDALGELNDRLAATQASAQRNERRKRAEAALAKTSERAKLAEQVDKAIKELAVAWPKYQEQLRKDLGTVSGAGGDVGPVERGLIANRQNDVLVRSLVSAGGMGLARALGVETAIRERHAISLADAEERVAASLRTELLRIRASSPQPNVSAEARAELEKMEKSA